jgi:YfiH family protein
MYSFRNDPGADGAGVACCDAVAPGGARLDLTLGVADGWRSPDWELVEADLGMPVLNAYQVHGTHVLVVDAGSDPRAVAAERADALVTTQRRLAVAVRVADCVPVLFADPDAGVVGAAHAGRIGLGAGVLAATVTTMAGLGACRITAWIGPHICGECYEVPAGMQAQFCRVHPAAAATTSWGTPSLDLGAAAAAQLAALGCAVVRIDPCTRTTPTLHSYRRDAAAAGRQAALAWLP